MSSQHKASFVAYVGATGLAAAAVFHAWNPVEHVLGGAAQRVAGPQQMTGEQQLSTLRGGSFRAVPPAPTAQPVTQTTAPPPTGTTATVVNRTGTGSHVSAIPAAPAGGTPGTTKRPSKGTTSGGSTSGSTSTSQPSQPGSSTPANAGPGKGHKKGNDNTRGSKSGHHGKVPVLLPTVTLPSTPTLTPTSTPASTPPVAAATPGTAVSPYVTNLSRWSWLLPGTQRHAVPSRTQTAGSSAVPPGHRHHQHGADCARPAMPVLFGRHRSTTGPSGEQASAHPVGLTTSAPGRHRAAAGHSRPADGATAARAHSSSHPAGHSESRGSVPASSEHRSRAASATTARHRAETTHVAPHSDHAPGRHRAAQTETQGRHSNGHTDAHSRAAEAGGHPHGRHAADVVRGDQGHGHHEHGHHGHGLDGVGWH